MRRHQHHTPEAWRESARRSLSEAGHRSGGARAAVIDLLAGQDCCLSAQQIADRVRGDGGRIGLASVYRALELLHGMGLVQRVELGDGGSRFEPVLPGGDHHHHAVCDRCGRVTAFEDPRLEKAIDALAERLEHSPTSHEVVIHGACSRCAGAAPRQAVHSG